MPINLNDTSKLNALISGLPLQITSKLYDKQLTGNGYSKVGYFKRTHNTINDLAKSDSYETNGNMGLINYNHYLNDELNVNNNGTIELSMKVMDLLLPIGHNTLTEPLSWLSFDKFQHQFKLAGQIENKTNDQVYDVYVNPHIETMTKYHVTKQNPKVKFNFSGATYVLLVDHQVTKLNQIKIMNDQSTSNWDYQWIQNNLIQSHNLNQAILIREPRLDFNEISKLIDAFKANHVTVDSSVAAMMDGSMPVNLSDSVKKHIRDFNVANLLTSQGIGLSQHLISDSIVQLNMMAKKANDAHEPDVYLKFAQQWSTLFANLQSIVDNYLTADDFNDLYQVLALHQQAFQFMPSAFNAILTKSLRLLLAKSLNELKQLNDTHQLYSFEPTNDDYTKHVNASTRFSAQQKDLVLTTNPLTVGTAGAGSGKSHTLIGRLAYLKGEGEDLNTALVLSFTNTAANNIKMRYPNVNSITLGNLFNQIYHLMYANQELSADETVMNSLAMLDIKINKHWKTNDDVNRGIQVRNQLYKGLSQLDSRGYKKANHNVVLSYLSQLIINHFDDVLYLLDCIKQTTLELEPIIIYSLIMNNQSIKLPKTYQNINFVITDESQDISTFEYILLMTLTANYKAQFMIMGDGTQTLYEFRSSNPQFLNAIEASGVFKTYKLTTNYRSNGAILAYANQFLNVIDANKYAHIQLSPNSLAPVSVDEFKQTVHVTDYGLESTKGPDYTTELSNRILHDAKFKQWLDSKIQKHEQVAFMAFTRAETAMVSKLLATLYSNSSQSPKILDITPNRTKQATMLSEAVRRNYHIIDQLGLNHYGQAVANLIQDSIIDRFKNASKAFIPAYVKNALVDLFGGDKYKSLYVDVRNNKIKKQKLTQFVTNSLLQAEIHYNAVYSLLQRDSNDNTNQQARENADILISTIHSAKGLEFDNTVIIYNEAKASSTSQASLRLYGVALTRAKDTEYILNVYHQSSNPNNVKTRVITDNQSDMFSTPMMTAQLRVLSDLKMHIKTI